MGIAPYNVRQECADICGGVHGPRQNERALHPPTFRTINGSGANAEMILHLMPLAKPYKRVVRTKTT